MGFFDTIKNAMSLDDEDDDSLYEAEMRELERKEKNKAAKSRRNSDSSDGYEDDEEEDTAHGLPEAMQRKKPTAATEAAMKAQEPLRQEAQNRHTMAESLLQEPRDTAPAIILSECAEILLPISAY